MSDVPHNIKRQTQMGYLMLAGAVLILLGTAGALWYTDASPISYLGALVPFGILTFFGYRAISAGRDRRALGDERTEKLYGKVGLNAFWILLSVIVVDMGFSVLPSEHASTIYVWVGLFAYGSYFVYYRYVE
ncbi:hypothetical protein C479_07283 [Halovivax asiaticus JCM 14624]|uniref:DUF2178 domain-containing protein n=1 Tax=Halovivax asiaticus JCM 14624 TaxID=1227490 RepID=M0BKU9_9EURY|nr:hypothetical protein [Halovivax asiaticus]ELZ11092.1 hypothetical protein C479_07283 [Halovivax asiaticus JCM 14624]